MSGPGEPAVSTHDLSGGGDVLDRVARFAQRAAVAYGCPPASTVRLLNVSENATYLVEHPDQGPCVLRVHRLGYHTGAEIESELAWMDALRAEAGVRTPRVLPAPGGQRMLTLPDAGGASAGESLRHCVRFEYLPGTEPADDDATHFAELGEITARMHRHSREWARPSWFTRFSWDYETAFGAQPRWGRWQDGIGVGPAERAVLGRLAGALAAGWPGSAPGRAASGWSTPTPGWPTCWWTAAGSASSTSTTPASAGSSTMSAPR